MVEETVKAELGTVKMVRMVLAVVPVGAVQMLVMMGVQAVQELLSLLINSNKMSKKIKSCSFQNRKKNHPTFESR